ncbi:uncharacterized protein LOC116426918 [Nomia melanderi]|uniref:uncharacterized protein LOC116426918 n=1 Tax=Nomia melanderi TaxID=2448451 RepID=UPI0013044682|nr:uncharacterized protein LOC116426918 [Nomia melanderi]
MFGFSMDNISKVESSSQNSSVCSTNLNAKCRDDSISLEEQSLLELVQRGISETTQENITFRKEIIPLLSTLNLEPQSLPNDIKEGLQKVALILRFEKLSDLDDIVLRIVCEERKIEERKKQREEKQLALLYDNLFRKYTKFSKKLSHLQEAVNTIEEFVKDSQKDQTDSYCNQVLLSTKLKEYKQTVEKLETDLTEMQIEDLYPQKILNKYNKYMEMCGELAELNQDLNQYGDLPPNLLQAKALIEVKQEEYETLEKVFLEKTSYS